MLIFKVLKVFRLNVLLYKDCALYEFKMMKNPIWKNRALYE